MIRYLPQGTETSIVIDPTPGVSPKPVERRGAIAFVGRAMRLKAVGAPRSECAGFHPGSV